MTACQEVNVYIKRELRRNVMQRLIAYVSGKVQKSGYRARVVTIAQNLRLKGYVQNLEDGRVKVVAEGESIDLEILLRALDIKNTLIHVVDIKKEYSSSTGDFEGFFKVVSGGGETDHRLDVAAEKLTELIVVNKEILIELKETREDLKSEIKATREELKETREDIIESSGTLVGEIRELRSDMKETLDERLMRIESDVSQIKAKVGL
jgi:acylphosphatase